MRTRTIALLLGFAVVAVGGGWYFGTATRQAEQTTLAAGTLMFPDLAPKLKDAAKIEVTHQGKQTVIEKRPDNGWGIAAMHGYPVQDAKLRAVLIALTELRLTEPRTSDPAQFSRLGLDDPSAASSSADLLQVLDAAAKPIAAVIVGHRRARGQANVPEEVYVRRPGDNQSWLAEGNVQADADPTAWLDRTILNIGHDRIASVVVGDDALKFGRIDNKFSLVQPDDHPKLEDYKLEDVSRALENLTLQAIQPDAGAPGQEVGHSVFTTNDGLSVRATVLHADKDIWARFAINASSDITRAEAEKLHTRLAGWTYQLGSWKKRSLMPTIDDLKAESAAKPDSPDPEPDAGQK